MDAPTPGASGSRRRALYLAALSLPVIAAHAVFLPWLGRPWLGAVSVRDEAIQRMDVAFVRDLQPRDPEPVVAALPTRPQTLRAPLAARVEPPASVASAVEPDPPVPAPELPAAPSDEPSVVTAALVAPLPAEAGEAAVPVADAPTEAEPATPGAPDSPSAAAFEWPVSTRLTYLLEGDFRGPVQGWAQVDWLRQGSRYQVHLDLRIAGIVSRRLSSEGWITPQGLQPERYQEETQILLGAPRHRLVRFDAGRVILSNGRQELALPEVQDTASQFVQLSWLFSTQSHRLTVGEAIEVPLALPTRMGRWFYTVHAQDDLSLPVGVVPAFHLKPQRDQARADELTIDTWFAPSLQYLPVRILIRQDAQTFIDLSLSRLPQQAKADEPTTR